MSKHYEVQIEGKLSQRARAAFPGMCVEPSPSQTTITAALDDPSDLGELMARCMGMGLRVVSLRRLPSVVPPDQGGAHPRDGTGDRTS